MRYDIFTAISWHTMKDSAFFHMVPKRRMENDILSGQVQENKSSYKNVMSNVKYLMDLYSGDIYIYMSIVSFFRFRIENIKIRLVNQYMMNLNRYQKVF
jgi:hypothetical protein